MWFSRSMWLSGEGIKEQKVWGWISISSLHCHPLVMSDEKRWIKSYSLKNMNTSTMDIWTPNSKLQRLSFHSSWYTDHTHVMSKLILMSFRWVTIGNIKLWYSLDITLNFLISKCTIYLLWLVYWKLPCEGLQHICWLS